MYGSLTLAEMRSLEVLATEGPQTVEALTERLGATVSPPRLSHWVSLCVSCPPLIITSCWRCRREAGASSSTYKRTASLDSDHVRVSPRHSW